MRWLVLYVRSRGAAASTGIALAAAAALGGLAAAGEAGFTRTVLTLFAVTVVVSVAATSLAGPDPALERTAALDWRWRRAVHAVAVGVLASAVALLGVVTDVPSDVVVRNATGLAGLAALGVTVLGGGLAWCLPMGWAVTAVTAALATRTPPAPLLTWPVQPSGTGAATVAACVLGAVGLTAYALAGPSTRS
ncbi:hypothetical protein [Actinophytocola glycyrrhizae]|uniref:ABC transporter permease n=1 Tax=Actinophytocola glycyrrhizae TaxID=2044873 RepID=A0ABV9S905_9PSEU